MSQLYSWSALFTSLMRLQSSPDEVEVFSG
jgi:hypothetical protein